MSLVRKILLEAKSEIFFHGSDNFLPVDTILSPNEIDYHNKWKSLDSYIILEKYRPKNKLPHNKSVFMVKNDSLIDAAGGGNEYVFTVIPLGRVERHDMAWGTKISMLLSEGVKEDDWQIKQCAENYWDGTPYFDKSMSLWEYLTDKAKIIKVEEY